MAQLMDRTDCKPMKNMKTQDGRTTVFAAITFVLLTAVTALGGTQYWSGANTWDSGLLSGKESVT